MLIEPETNGALIDYFRSLPRADRKAVENLLPYKELQKLKQFAVTPRKEIASDTDTQTPLNQPKIDGFSPWLKVRLSEILSQSSTNGAQSVSPLVRDVLMQTVTTSPPEQGSV